jgi:hypothetical protein
VNRQVDAADQSTGEDARARRGRTLLCAVVLGALVLAGYLRFLDAGWAGTDSLTLAVSNRVHSIGDAFGLLVIPVMPGTSFAEGELIYRPAASLLFALDGLVWSLNPVGFHVTNIALHLVATLGVFALARRLGGSRLAAGVGAAVFALHPAMVATIPVIARRDNMVSAAPLVWSLVLLVDVAEKPTRRTLRLVGSLVLFAIALLGKESGFAAAPLVPLVVVLSCPWRGWLAGIGRAIGLSIPYALVWVALFETRWLVLGSLGGYVDAPVGRLDVHANLGLLASLTRYWLWAFTPLAPADSRVWPLLAALALVAVPLLALAFPRRTRNLVWFGVFWTALFAGFFLGVRTLSGAWLLYYPLMGVAFVLTGLLDGARAAWSVRPLVGAASAALSALFVAGAAIASPLVTQYPEWQMVGQTVQGYLDAAVGCVGDAPDGTRVFLDRPPGFLDYPGMNNDLLVPVLVTDYTLGSALEVTYPDRRFRIDDNGFGDVFGPPGTVQVTCGTDANGRVVHAAY